MTLATVGRRNALAINQSHKKAITMFTVKFYKAFEDGKSQMTAISCVNYSVYSREQNNHEICTHKDMTDIDGVCRNVSQEESHFDLCYIENSSGKTIDKYSAFVKSKDSI